MSNTMQGAHYPQMAFDPTWQMHPAYATATAFNPYNVSFDFTRSPNTSGGSDESMSDGSKIDPKRSPKYLEKRMKNNEAAKKSRASRKHREQKNQTENELLKRKNAALEEELKQAKCELAQMQITIRDMSIEREAYRRENEMLKMVNNKFADSKFEPPQPLRDMTNCNLPYKYELLS